MALEGTFETFSVLDVVGWLQDLGRVGLLESQGANGDVHLWIADGGIVAEDSPDGDEITPALALFDILRVGPGEWRFVSDDKAPDDIAHAPVDVMSLVAELEAMVTEWSEILDVVPSTEADVRLIAAIDQPVTLNEDRWAIVRILAGGPVPVGRLIESLGVHDLDGRRRVADLVEGGIASVDGGAPRRVIDLTAEADVEAGKVDQASA